MAGSDLLALLHQSLAAQDDVKGRGFAAQTVGDQFHVDFLVLKFHHHGVKEQAQDLLGGIAQGAQQHGGRQFAAAVDAHEQIVAVVKLEVEPGTAVGDHAGREQNAAGMGLALIIVKKHARRTVQL